jgi:ketosteroid isomerase-like protein
MADEQEIGNVIQRRLDALRAGDFEKLEGMLADDFISTSATGFVQSKADVVNDVRSGDWKVRSAQPADIKVRIYGDTAVAAYRNTMDAVYKGQNRGGQSRVLAVYVKSGGDWKLVAQQITSLRLT